MCLADCWPQVTRKQKYLSYSWDHFLCSILIRKEQETKLGFTPIPNYPHFKLLPFLIRGNMRGTDSGVPITSLLCTPLMMCVLLWPLGMDQLFSRIPCRLPQCLKGVQWSSHCGTEETRLFLCINRRKRALFVDRPVMPMMNCISVRVLWLWFSLHKGSSPGLLAL